MLTAWLDLVDGWMAGWLDGCIMDNFSDYKLFFTGNKNRQDMFNLVLIVALSETANLITKITSPHKRKLVNKYGWLGGWVEVKSNLFECHTQSKIMSNLYGNQNLLKIKLIV
jgi:hypothetical protein